MSRTALKEDPQKKPAMACAALLCASVVLVAFGRHPHRPTVIDPAAVRASVALRFSDLADGTVVASDAASGAELEHIAPGAGGFIRVTMRSFANERKQRGMGSEVAFTLMRMTDGDLLLQDPQTGRTMLLNAFGPSNEGVFAELLNDERTTR